MRENLLSDKAIRGIEASLRPEYTVKEKKWR